METEIFYNFILPPVFIILFLYIVFGIFCFVIKGAMWWDDRHWQKEVDEVYAHRLEVVKWNPRCHCMQYCSPRRTSIHVDSERDPVIRPITLTRSKSQGATRPQHCSQSSGSHPGYKRIDNSILNNIFYLKNAILHKGGRAKPANCIRRQT